MFLTLQALKLYICEETYTRYARVGDAVFVTKHLPNILGRSGLKIVSQNNFAILHRRDVVTRLN